MLYSGQDDSRNYDFPEPTVKQQLLSFFELIQVFFFSYLTPLVSDAVT